VHSEREIIAMFMKTQDFLTKTQKTMEDQRINTKYAAESTGFGYCTKVTNALDGRRYNISTVPRRTARQKLWETAVLKSGFFGAFRPRFSVITDTDDYALKIHDEVREFVEGCPPAKWPTWPKFFATIISGIPFMIKGHQGPPASRSPGQVAAVAAHVRCACLRTPTGE
jgi:hypothetical protein